MNDNRDSNKLNQVRQKMSELEKTKRDLDRLRQDAIAELLQKRKEITRELRQLGYEGRGDDLPATNGRSPSATGELSLSDLRPPPRAVRRRPAPRPERPCPICTIAGHASRAHRGQEIEQPVTPSELRERGLALDSGGG